MSRKGCENSSNLRMPMSHSKSVQTGQFWCFLTFTRNVDVKKQLNCPIWTILHEFWAFESDHILIFLDFELAFGANTKLLQVTGALSKLLVVVFTNSIVG